MKKEYTSSVTLMILSERGNARHVTRTLHLRPSSSWDIDKKHKWTGWKKHLPKTVDRTPLEKQLSYWIGVLSKRKSALSSLRTNGYYLALDIYISTDATASIVLQNRLARPIAQLGVDLRFSIFADPR